MWTAKFVYNQFHQVTAKTDARGVVTNYSYDALNRVTDF
ncbi:MAG: RHS repeat domain-containing protein [Acidobacteriota bacterium]